MRTYMKRLTATTFVILAVAFGAVAQESHSGEENVIRTYALEQLEIDLHTSGVPGIVEGAIYTVVELKHSFPDLDYSRLLSAINEVAQKNDNLSIVYEAQLASMYLRHSSDIQIAPIPDAENHGYLFKQISDQLQQAFLAGQTDQNIRVQK